MQFCCLLFTTPLALLSIELVFQTLNIAIWEEYENATTSGFDGDGCTVFVPVPIQLHKSESIQSGGDIQ